MKISTSLVQTGVNWDKKTGSISMPIYQNATFSHPKLGESTGYDYSRSGNPTRQVLEEKIAELEGGARGLAFSSGMAAISAILGLFKPGDQIVVSEDIYGGTYRLLKQIYEGYGITFTQVDTSSPELVLNSITAKTKALFIETPTNPMMRVSDLEALGKIAAEHKLLYIVDNTFMTPYYQRPIEFGADIVIHSGTKYLAGHNDLVAGLLVAKDEKLGEKLYFLQNGIGAILGPQDAWLLIRGLKTLAIRLERQSENAMKLASFLESHPKIARVYYPGLGGFQYSRVHNKQASGCGGMVSFEVISEGLVAQVLERTTIVNFAESLGGVETLITYPVTQTHADIPLELREKLGITSRLLRLSVGIEDIEDLVKDFERALA